MSVVSLSVALCLFFKDGCMNVKDVDDEDDDDGVVQYCGLIPINLFTAKPKPFTKQR